MVKNYSVLNQERYIVAHKIFLEIDTLRNLFKPRQLPSLLFDFH